MTKVNPRSKRKQKENNVAKIGPDMPGLEISIAEGSDSAPKPVAKAKKRDGTNADRRHKNEAGEYTSPLRDDEGKILPSEYRSPKGNLIRFN